MWTDEAKNDLIKTSLRLAEKKIEDRKLSHHPGLHRQVVEQCMEEHDDRVAGIELLFFQKRTGHPF